MNENIREFTSEDRFEIQGRGTVYSVTPIEEIPFNEVFNHLVLINGKVFYCTGIERTAICRQKPYPLLSGEKINLLVRVTYKE